MKKKFIAATMVALVAAGAYMGAGTLTRSTELSELQLANVEALAEDIEIGKGSICYNDAKYDSSKPFAVVCDIPCKYWPACLNSDSTSECLK